MVLHRLVIIELPYLFDLRRPSKYATFGHFAHIAPYKFIFLCTLKLYFCKTCLCLYTVYFIKHSVSCYIYDYDIS